MDYIDALKAQQNNERIDYLINDCKRMGLYAFQYKDQVRTMFDEQVKAATLIQYSVGGDEMHRGYYCPSPTYDLIVGKCNRGKVLKSIIEDSKISFQYYFDKNNNLKAINHLSVDLEVIIYNDAGSVGISFNTDDSINNISECRYIDGRIQSYTKCLYNSYTASITSYEKEDYIYKEGLLEATISYTFLPDTKLLCYEQYVFEHDEEGYLKTYKVIENENGIEKEDSYWKGHFFKISKKRKV